MEHKKILSFVLPVYNEGGNITHVTTNLIQTIAPLLHNYSYEIILVDDGSTDDSWKNIESIIRCHDNVHGIRFSRNF